MDLFSGLWTIIVGAIAFFSGCCFAGLAPSGYLERITAVHYTLLGIVGTTLIVASCCAFCRKPVSWHFIGLRRDIVLVIFSLAWLFGAVGGIAVFYVIPR
jgi:hypothetical protein